MEFGITSLPVVFFGDQFACGLDTEKLTELIGKEVKPQVQLSAEELIHKINLFTQAAMRYTKQVPSASLEKKVLTTRNRTWRELIYHIFFIPRIFLASYHGEAYSSAPNHVQPPDSINSQLIQYGEQSLSEMNRWWKEHQNISFEQERDTYYGTVTLHDILERTAWHSAQHVRQMMDFLENSGIKPDTPLTEIDFRGLPLPKAVWE